MPFIVLKYTCWPEYNIFILTLLGNFQQTIFKCFNLVICQFHAKKLIFQTKILYYTRLHDLTMTGLTSHYGRVTSTRMHVINNTLVAICTRKFGASLQKVTDTYSFCTSGFGLFDYWSTNSMDVFWLVKPGSDNFSNNFWLVDKHIVCYIRI